jgi:hypothetical protein
MRTWIFGATVARTWSYCEKANPVKTFLRGVSTHAETDRDVGTVVETTTGLTTPRLRWIAMAPVQMASALLSEAQAEAEKRP